MFIGFSLTQHCNLRCPHCIRDDVGTVRSLPLPLVQGVVEQAQALFGAVTVSLTGGEPLLHPQFAGLAAYLSARGIPWRFVSNGWHLKRVMGALATFPPEFVRLSLSGATEAVHDQERGRGSFRRVLLAAALLTNAGIPHSLSLVVDRRTRGHLAAAAELAEALGAMDLHYILPQPVPGSAARDSDLPPGEWLPVRREIETLRDSRQWLVPLVLDYGAPSDGPEEVCDTMRIRRLYVDAHGRLSLCCQLSEYGFNDADVVADLTATPLDVALARHRERMAGLHARTRPSGGPDPFDRFPCMRCARACGKTAWLASYPRSPWHGAAVQAVASRPLVQLAHGASGAPAPRRPDRPPARVGRG